MPKNFYLVLGIPSNAALGDIKDAYRRLAKEFHPDHYGENPSRFIAIQEAYAVLSDPIKRQSHDLIIQENQKRERQKILSRERIYRQDAVEPLIPEKRPVEALTPMGPARSANGYAPSFDQLFDRIFHTLCHSLWEK